MFTRHDDLTALTYGDIPRADNEAMARIYHLAAEYDLPVMVHSNITSKRERNPLYLAEIEAHRHQRKLTILRPTLERLLADYPNL